VAPFSTDESPVTLNKSFSMLVLPLKAIDSDAPCQKITRYSMHDGHASLCRSTAGCGVNPRQGIQHLKSLTSKVSTRAEVTIITDDSATGACRRFQS
jgi:hypothetical protein